MEKGEISSIAVANDTLHAFEENKCTFVFTRSVLTAEKLEADLEIRASDMLKGSSKIETSYRKTVEDIKSSLDNGPTAVAVTADSRMRKLLAHHSNLAPC